MDFVPAGEIIDGVQIRTVRISDAPGLPDGEYSFVDMYCTDPTCDCRKTMITVLHNGRDVATIDFGWESDSYYQKWIGGAFSGMPKMSGTSIARCAHTISSDGLLALFNHLLDKKWTALFRTNYGLVKKKLAERPNSKRSPGNRGTHRDDGARHR